MASDQVRILKDALASIYALRNDNLKKRATKRKEKRQSSFENCRFFWRRKRDLNPRAGFPTYSLSRGAPSPLGYFCVVNYENIKLMVPLIGLEPIRYCYRGILSPLCLPIPPQRHLSIELTLIYYTLFLHICQPLFAKF